MKAHRLLILLLVGCGEDGGPGSPVASSVSRVAGQDQVAPASTVLPDSLAVIVRNAAGDPLAGITVSWAAATGGGSVAPATVVTGTGGIARAARTLGTNAGAHTTTATVQGLTPVTFDAVAQIQGATQMGSNSIGPAADTVLGTLTEFEQPLIVVVMDQHGVPVQGVSVQWTASGGGSVASPTKLTDAGGQSIMEYTFGAIAGGQYRASAAVPGLIGSPIEFMLNAHPATPVALEKANGDSLVVQVGGQVIHTVKARDSYGNGTQGVTIDWIVVAGGGAIVPAQNITGNGGLAQATRTLGPSTGTQAVTATAGAIIASPSVSFTTTAATTVVRVTNNTFLPDAVTIQQGDSVAWQWQGTTAAHNITFAATAGKPADAADRTAGVVWRTFGTAGTFTYQCTNHAGMTGTVTVNP